MPTKQNMLQSEYPNYDQTGVHSTSNTARLQSAYPNSPIYQGKAKKIEDFSDDGIKEWYESEVLNGDFDNYSEFGTSNYDYEEAPEIPGIVDDPIYGEAQPGLPGSTIVASGKGPNVATLDLSDLASAAIVDTTSPSTPPGAGAGSDASPKETSKATGEKKSLSETGIPGVSTPIK